MIILYESGLNRCSTVNCLSSHNCQLSTVNCHIPHLVLKTHRDQWLLSYVDVDVVHLLVDRVDRMDRMGGWVERILVRTCVKKIMC